MNTPLSNQSRNRLHNGGFTLVELLVSVVLALLLTGAITSVFLGSRQSFRTGEGVAQVQEQGRFASLLVAPVVRQAGYLNDPINQIDPTAVFSAALNKRAVFGWDNTQPPGASYAGASFTDYKPGTDALAVSFMGRNATVPVADTPLKSCMGDDITDTQIAVNIFYIAQPAGDTTPSLYCYRSISPTATNANAAANFNAQPLVPGVRDMQIVYGIDTDGDGNANQYVTAAAVTDWTLVSSIQITFTIDSTDQTEIGRTDSAVTAGVGVNGVNSGRIRRTFNTTIQIRNRLRS